MSRKPKPREPYVHVPADKLRDLIGRKVHLSGAWHPGCVWVLVDVSDCGEEVKLRTPKTGHVCFAEANRVQYARRDQPGYLGWFVRGPEGGAS